jgi:hypothetical protein
MFGDDTPQAVEHFMYGLMKLGLSRVAPQHL